MSLLVSECLVGHRTLCQIGTDISSFLFTAKTQTRLYWVLVLFPKFFAGGENDRWLRLTRIGTLRSLYTAE